MNCRTPWVSLQTGWGYSINYNNHPHSIKIVGAISLSRVDLMCLWLHVILVDTTGYCVQ